MQVDICLLFSSVVASHDFQVKDESKAKRVGLKLGDSIVSIEDKDTEGMTLKEANEALLHATNNIRSFKLGVIRYKTSLALLKSLLQRCLLRHSTQKLSG